MAHQSAALPMIARARSFGDRTAVVAPEGTFSYRHLLDRSAAGATTLLGRDTDLQEARVAFLVPPGFTYVATQWAVWRAGGVAVPLAISHPPAELEMVLRDADPSVAVAHADLVERIRPLVGDGVRLLTTPSLWRMGPGATLPAIDEDRRAMMVYTSGTTGRPKGVMITHANLRAQVTSLVGAWGWRDDDRVLSVLPLHHVHGIVNVLMCALWSGAVCEMRPGFDADDTWNRLAGGRVTLFMAVPTIYRRLIAAWERAPAERRRRWSEGARRLRLMVSGSAALAVETLERWREITGHVLLERYGMTEIGMVLSNPLDGERRPGFVGTPLPGVRVRLVDEEGREVPPGTAGEIQVRGPQVFREYWRRPAETRAAFDGAWFRTGDVAVVEAGGYRILGRRSVDIIKSGGYKVSALEIEDAVRAHPAVTDCAAVGLPDADWGERVAIAVELESRASLTLDELREWAKVRLAPYKIPRTLRVVETLPRNAVGKVTKGAVRRLFSETP